MTEKRREYKRGRDWSGHLRRLKNYRCSVAWRELRERVLDRDNYQCRNSDCGGGCGILDVHHLHYDNVFHEELEDLVTLCRDCHDRIHYDGNGKRRWNWRAFNPVIK